MGIIGRGVQGVDGGVCVFWGELVRYFFGIGGVGHEWGLWAVWWVCVRYDQLCVQGSGFVRRPAGSRP